ncbi:hypothetical protein [Massilibacteroides sp.]|uniref:hypothetical protein n=1 Tax=Massilibacteroides sp. TaxID=2034766 RepID=UPI002622EAE4|nr:hypothetical protein [Massilibacteroides sp.]MDD4516352.1 hypothetical protein [Massilibacteroides sp.]
MTGDELLVGKFSHIEIKPFSYKILEGLEKVGGETTSIDLAERMNLLPRQIDAALTRSLVRWGFARRELREKKPFKVKVNMVILTPLGKEYLEYRRKGKREESL